jgi:catechol 2,3-dioxygenase-like lactoylglutathione lyase family enzyme
MIDHVTLRVSNYEKSRDFYTRALAPLGFELAVEYLEGDTPVCGW